MILCFLYTYIPNCFPHTFPAYPPLYLFYCQLHSQSTHANVPNRTPHPRMSTSTNNRLAALSNHIVPKQRTENMAAAPPKPPITCHVLDTTIGRPAASIPVTLTLHNASPSPSSSPLTFSGTTNSDGRVTTWESSTPFSTTSVLDTFHTEGDLKWSLTFNTEAYFGTREIKTFFPEVEVKFVVRGEQKGEHFHVPVLLGPFGYTTYRGS